MRTEVRMKTVRNATEVHVLEGDDTFCGNEKRQAAQTIRNPVPVQDRIFNDPIDYLNCDICKQSHAYQEKLAVQKKTVLGDVYA